MKLAAKTMDRKRLCAVIVGMAIILVLAYNLVSYLTRWVDRSILTDSPCAAPCWQGITPGASISKEDVLQVLARLPNVSPSGIWQSSTDFGDGIAIRWYWKRSRKDTGANEILWTGRTVHHIVLSVDFDLTVEDIVSKYGQPQAVHISLAGVPEHYYIAVNMYYPERGLRFHAEVPLDYPSLLPTTKVIGLLYATPERLRKFMGPDQELQPWPGYGELEIPND